LHLRIRNVPAFVSSVTRLGCLDVTNVSTANKAPLQQWTCTGGTNQNFTLTAQS
jgi:Ricin-type beta-trefoil lectin domain-like